MEEGRSHRWTCAHCFGMGVAGFRRNLEWSGNAGNMGVQALILAGKGRDCCVSREELAIVTLLSCLPHSGSLLHQAFLKPNRKKLFTEKCDVINGGKLESGNRS